MSIEQYNSLKSKLSDVKIFPGKIIMKAIWNTLMEFLKHIVLLILLGVVFVVLFLWGLYYSVTYKPAIEFTSLRIAVIVILVIFNIFFITYPLTKVFRKHYYIMGFLTATASFFITIVVSQLIFKALGI